MIDSKQKMRFTGDELSLMKGLFSETDDLLYLVRKVMFQFPMTGQEKEDLKLKMTGPVMRLMQKVFLPDLDADAPLFQMSNLVLGLGADIKTLSPEGAWPYIQAKQIEVDYLAQQLKVLNAEDIEIEIELTNLNKLSYLKTQKEQAYVNITAWNFLLSFIDSNLQQIKYLAGKKEETVEETLARLAKDSAR